MYQDSERRKKANQKQKKLKDIEIEQMHKKTNQILKLSKIFKSAERKSDKRNSRPGSITSEVKSDHEIKEIITELQKEGK